MNLSAKHFVKLWTFVVLIACGVVSGCGGGGGAPVFPFAGTYRGEFTGTHPTSVIVSVGTSGQTDAIVSDSTGVLVKGSGTTTEAGAVTVSMTGSAGATALTGSFTTFGISRGPKAANGGLNINLNGGVNASNVNLPNTGNVSVYKGKYKFQFTGSSSGDLKVTISANGTVYKREGTTLTQVGTITPIGAITFGGTGLVTPPTTDTDWTGQLFVTPSSAGGSGNYVGKSNASFSGSWNAVPEAPINAVFNQITAVKGVNPSDFVGVQTVSANGHMVGFSGDNPAYWDSPTSVPVQLLNPGSSNLTYMTGVNSAGAKVGYSYSTGQDPNSAIPAYWAPGSTSPSVLPLPNHYVAGSPSGINDAGDIVGVIVHETNHFLAPCVWPAGGGTPFIPPQGDCGGIANNGVVVCLANKGYLPNTTAQNVNPIPPANGYAPLELDGMSFAGVIFGNGPLGTDGLKHPIAWPNLTQAGVPLKFLSGYNEMIVHGAGISGEYVGTGKIANTNTKQAFYWANSSSVFLLDDIVKDNVIAFSGGQHVFANGAIMAFGKYPNGNFVVAYLEK